MWRVRCKGTWLYVYLLFEFQSTINQFMAIRMLVYVGLLYQELIKNKEFGSDEKLPFVLPIVLYNGTPRWSAPLGTQDLIGVAPQGFERHIPRLDYFLIDEGSYNVDYLSDSENLAAIIFLIETQTTLDGLHKALAKVLKWPNTAKHQALSTAIAKLATRVLRKKLPNTPDAPDSINDLKGVVSMLAENIENMILESKKEALKEGRKEGIKEGLKEGMKQGGAMMLKAMLASRFGPVPGWASAKIDAATADELAQWGTHLLDASSMEEIFKTRS
jgi:predicted transposase/invertase (TIGR01784 family)